MDVNFGDAKLIVGSGYARVANLVRCSVSTERNDGRGLEDAMIPCTWGVSKRSWREAEDERSGLSSMSSVDRGTS
jgi:hypothetical protein